MIASPSSGRVVITDFGLSRAFNGESRGLMQTVCGTPIYIAPEILSETMPATGGYDKKVDMWSLGVILYYMCAAASIIPIGSLLNQVCWVSPVWAAVARAAL